MKRMALTWTAVLLAVAWITAATQDRRVLFEKALALEEAQGKLQEAIALYQKIVDESGDKSLAARAQLRIGICHQKLGRREAQSAFQKVIDNYPEQVDTVRLAREQLALLARAQAVVEKPQGPMIRQVWSGPETDTYGAPSPDGKHLSFVDWSTSDLAIRDLETGKNRRLTSNTPPFGEYPLSSRWSPDGKQLVYQWCEREGRPVELWVIGVDGSKARVLYSTKEPDEWAEPHDWSPDGRQILATIRRNRLQHLALVAVADGSVRELRPPTQLAANARFSPDGRYVIYDTLQSEDSVDRDIHLLSLQDGRDRPLVSHRANDSVLGWAPSGQFVLFLSDRTGSPCFWSLAVADGKPQGSPEMIRAAGMRTLPLGFTRDGRFFYGEGRGQSDIYQVRIDPQAGRILGSPEKLVDRYEGFSFSPAYSRDGRHLAYCSRRDDSGQGRANTLCILALQTGQERTYLQEFKSLGVADVTAPRWSPDDQSILIYGYKTTSGGYGGIYLFDVSTGKVTSVVQSGSESYVSSAWWSSDGKEIVYVRGDRNRQLARIVRRSLDGDGEKTIYELPESSNRAMQVSPDGKRICLLTAGANAEVFSVMDATGGEPRKVYELTGQGGLHNEFAWAADGKHLLFSRREKGMGWQLWRLPLDGGAPVLLGLAERSRITRLSAHPDGGRIAFSRDTMGGAEVWVMENFSVPAK